MSETAKRQPRLWVPRAVLVAWLLANVPATLLEWTGCPWADRQPFCERVGNTVGDLFDLLPMTLMLALPTEAPLALRFAVPAILTLVCVWLTSKFLPARLSLWWFVLFVIAWFVLSNLALFGELFLPYYVYGQGRSA